MAAVVFVHVDTAAACRKGHTGDEQQRCQSEDCFSFHDIINVEKHFLLYSHDTLLTSIPYQRPTNSLSSPTVVGVG